MRHQQMKKQVYWLTALKKRTGYKPKPKPQYSVSLTKDEAQDVLAALRQSLRYVTAHGDFDQEVPVRSTIKLVARAAETVRRGIR